MKIYVGSLNPSKLTAVTDVFENDTVVEMDVDSKVSSQPFSDEETLEGAIHRARECAMTAKADLGIGLEGGVMEIGDDLYLCNWGALVDQQENIYTAAGARIPLPDEIHEQMSKGLELGEVMEKYAQKSDVRKKEGAVGIFTNGQMNRDKMFRHIVTLLKGQWEYDNL
ncbi:inosine/xanthosine triphosphatase [Salimicrobium jeotgali]|uniref:inosine/xanthosine triphosphatase n=2 Tax=Salimicrobium TaxID=351195 RepID=K2GA35_9BACI|nr:MULTISPECIES: DUF84 family protein [Salimicrobium]AKG04069.1 inosine/xanthosine triphosphatase [Salimicrobium jeotgali]EKE31187.1 NTPase [Salimicrobium jeotgali]MBM7697251.1 inosine/xanthosine triphosphatase [Salimicrobium jeotgali]PBB05014.1 inosine/xanthosine triphosphatase [Salimicrobium humidisoli]